MCHSTFLHAGCTYSNPPRKWYNYSYSNNSILLPPTDYLRSVHIMILIYEVYSPALDCSRSKCYKGISVIIHCKYLLSDMVLNKYMLWYWHLYRVEQVVKWYWQWREICVIKINCRKCFIGNYFQLYLTT